MCELKIRKIWELSYEDYCTNGFFHSAVQKNAARAILNRKSGKLGVNLNRCSECGHVGLFRFFTHGIRKLTTMYTCTVSSPALVLQRTGKFENPRVIFSFP